ncbi:MAG TPA: cytochrome c [Bradyrhizobium sp.]|jgi:mono/diheme cytochrome c family protein|nr:cytochrome c [Bradyrhizobium sp.]
MRMREPCIAALALLALACATPSQAQSPYAIGRAAAPAEIAGWNIDVDGQGNNLPPGSGSVSRGHEVFDQQCAACHGATGEGGVGDRLVGGQGTLATPKPVRTVGSYWPYAPTLFDYIRRAMPQNAPQSLSNDDVYAVSAYILHLNGLLPADATLDAKALSAIKMPNRNMFTGDPRPDVQNPACTTDCGGGGVK